MQAPTVGRIVLFHPGECDELQRCCEGPMAAIVAAVGHVESEDAYVLNLTVFDHNGVPHSKKDIPLVDEEDADDPDETRGPHCVWMAYQNNKAKDPDRIKELEERVASLEYQLGVSDARKEPEAESTAER